MQSTLSNSINLIGFIFAAYVYSNILADAETAPAQFVSLLKGQRVQSFDTVFVGRFDDACFIFCKAISNP